MILAALLIVVLSGIALVALNLAYSYFFGCPPEMKHLPALPISRYLKSYLSGEPQDVRALMLAAIANEDGFARAWFLNRWTIIVADVRHVRKVLSDTDTFPKVELMKLYPDLLSAKLTGKNIVNTNGAEWKRHRKVVAPAFHNVQPYIGVFAEFANELSRIIDEKLEKDGSPVNMSDLFQRMAVDIICKAGFNYSLGALSGNNTKFLSAYKIFLKGMFDQLTTVFPILDKFNYGGRRTALIQSADELDKKFYEVIAERRKQIAAWNQQKHDMEGTPASETMHPPNDLLARMIHACDAEGMLTPEELRNDLLIFFIAGHETTGSALSSAIYFLSVNPTVQDIARANCNAIMAGKPKDATPTFEEQKQMTYLTCVLKESLRLNGPVGSLALRVCAAADGAYLGPQHVPQGTFLMPNIYFFHHDPRVWGENAAEFDPSRFAEQADEGVEMTEKSGVKASPWMPFGVGNRICTGKNFSLIEQHIILAYLLRQYKFSLPPDSKHRNGIVNASGPLIAPDNLAVIIERI